MSISSWKKTKTQLVKLLNHHFEYSSKLANFPISEQAYTVKGTELNQMAASHLSINKEQQLTCMFRLSTILYWPGSARLSPFKRLWKRKYGTAQHGQKC